MNNKNITGTTIRNVRLRKGLTQDELAAKLNTLGIEIDRTMISKIETMTREINDIEIKAISEVLNMRIEDLFKD